MWSAIFRRHARLACRAAMAGLLTALAACATGPGNTFLKFSTAEGDSLVTGARERVVTNHRPSIPERYGQVVPQVVVCAEPSPDVATSVANSVGFGISLFGKGSGALESAQVESLVQLAERTATIQLLRDQMYRACEAYSNGAMNGTNYTVLMSRLNETMATLMLGETAAGAFGRSLAAAGGKASAESSASLSGLLTGLQDLDEAAGRLAAAQAKVSDADKALAAAQKNLDGKTCDEAAGAACTAERQSLEKARDEARSKLDEARGQRDATLELLKGAVSATGKAGAESASVLAGGGLSQKPDEKVAKVLARMQREFMRRDPSQALIEACLVELGTSRSEHASPDAAYKVFELGVAKAEAERGFNGGNATSASFGTRQLFRSGLYDYCLEHLSSFADGSSQRRFQLVTQDNEIEAREVEAKAVEARARAAQAIAKALAECNGLADAGLKSECLRKVASLDAAPRPIAPDVPAATAAAAEPEAAALQFLPSHHWALARAACDALGALKKDPALVAALPKGKDGAADKEAWKALKDKRASLDAGQAHLLAQALASNKDAARQLDVELTERRTAIELAAGDAKRRIASAEYRVAQEKARDSVSQHAALRRDCDAARKGFERLLPEVASFNATHK